MLGTQKESFGLRAFPPELEFLDYQPNIPHTAVVKVKNISNQVKTVRMKAPTTSLFTVVCRPAIPVKLPPGLEMSIEITFQTPSTENYYDRLIMMTENEALEIPLRALVPSPRVVVQGTLNMGIVPVDQPITRTITVHNVGRKGAQVTIVPDRSLSNARFSFTTKSIEPEGMERLEVTWTPSDLGDFRSQVEVRVSESSDPSHPPSTLIPVSAVVVQPGLQMLDSKGNTVKKLDFGQLYYGERQRMRLELLNQNPTEVQWESLLLTAQGVVAGEDLEGTNLNMQPFSMTPADGVIEPFGRCQVEIEFKPQPESIRKGFLTSLNDASELRDPKEFLMSFQVLTTIGGRGGCDVSVAGKAFKPMVQLDTPQLSLGNVPSYSHADAMVKLTNLGMLPVTAFLPSSAYFHCDQKEVTVQPGTTAPFIVTFMPKSLGHHRSSLKIDIVGPSRATRILERSLELEGSCTEIGEKPANVGGVDKIPADFIRPRNFVGEMPTAKRVARGAHDDHEQSRPSSPHRRRTSIASFLMEDAREANATLLDPSMTYNPTERDRLAQNKSQYISFIRESYAQRMKRAHVVKPDTEGKLDSYGGLKPPLIPLPDMKEPLVLLDRNQLIARPRNRPPLSASELQQLERFRHKPRAETDKERLEVRQALNGPDLAKIQAYRDVEFGQIPPNTEIQRHFAVSNNLAGSILVKLITEEYAELKTSGPQLQMVIPPEGTAVFDIRLNAKELGRYERMVTYTINGLPMKVRLTADVVPRRLNASVDRLVFQFAPTFWEASLEQTFTIENPIPVAAPFQCVSTNPAFEIMPVNGIVPGKGSMEMKVKWTPLHAGAASAADSLRGTLIFNIPGAIEPKRIEMVGDYPLGTIVPRDKTVDVGAISVGVPASRILSLKNTGEQEAHFRVQPNSTVTVNPSMGRVAAGTTIDIEIGLEASEAMTISTMLLIDTRGSARPLKIPVKANAVLPSISVKEEELDFGTLYVGGAEKREFNMNNAAAVSGRAVIDLRGLNEFSIELPSSSWNAKDYDVCPISERVRQRQVSVFQPRKKSVTAGSENATLTFKGGSEYVVTVPPEKALKLFLVYRPSEPRELDMMLPMEAAGMESELRLAIKAVANESLIKVTPTEIDFGKRFINKTARVSGPHTAEISLQNNVNKELSFHFGAPKSPGPVALTVMSGVIPPLETLKIQATFMPTEEGEYSVSFPLYVDGQAGQTHEYSLITVRAEGANPRLKFDFRELVLCPVPLGVTSTGIIHVINEGYDNLELRAKLPADQARIPLSLSFPEGPLIGVAKEAVPVMISFQATRPTAFTAKVEFSDTNGRSFSVPVTGTADGCVLTLEPFLQANKSTLEFHQHTPESPVQLVNKPYTIPHTVANKSSQFCTIGPLESSTNLLRYFQVAAGMRNISADAFFDMVVSSKGGLVIEMLERWSGKNLPGKVLAFAHNRKDASEQALGQYDRMLTFLKSHGALLNAIKPEYLLEFEDLRRVVEARIAKASTLVEEEQARMWEQVEEAFKEVSRRSWNAILLQVFKVFVLNRVTSKALRGMPRMECLHEYSEKALNASSNIFSTPEHLLLWWLSESFKRTLPDCFERPKSFEADLNDCLAFFSVLSVHLPEPAKYIARLSRPAKDNGTKLQNAQVIVEILLALQLPFIPTAHELVNGTATDMIVFAMYLFNTLPQLLPKTVIEFTGKLSERQTKYLELHNPTSKPVTYNAKLEGHSDFYLPAETVRVEADQTVNFAVGCKPSITKPTEGLLMLVPMQDSSAVGGFLTFTLRSTVPTTTALATIEVEGKMYELKTFPLEIRNPFPADCELTVTLQNGFIEMENVKPESDKKENRAPGRHAKDGEKHKVKLPSSSSLINQMAKRFPLAFGMERARLKLKQNASETLTIYFMPFAPVMYTCRLMLEDPMAGALVYDIKGMGLPPDPCMRQTIPLELKEGVNIVQKDVQIHFVNTQIEAARKLYIDKHPLARDKTYGTTVRQLLDPKTRPDSVDYLMDSRNVRVEVPRLFTLKQHNKEDPLVLTLKQEGPGRYYTRASMTSSYDMRVLEFTLDCTSSPKTMSLDFSGPSRQNILQEIPLTNSFDKPLQLRAMIHGDGFTGPQSVTLDPEANGVYPLTFRAPWVGEYKGRLELQVPSTGESTVFTLSAVADEPVAEGHIALECSARSVTQCILKVPNVLGAKDVQYTVFSDLPAVRGESTLSVRGRSTAEYKMLIRPQRSGVLMGSITFTAPSGHYIWYTVELKVTAPTPVDTVDISCEVRKAVSLQIPLTNPLDRVVEMDVRFQGSGLLGKDHIALQPRESVQYTVFYSPLNEGSEEGRVYFSSEQVGEQWYKLRMTATQPRPTVLPDMDAQLGRTQSQVVTLQNPLATHAVFHASITNGRLFSVYPSTLEVEPFAEAAFRIDFTPSSLGDSEAAFVTISDPNAGRWEFETAGRGLPPVDVLDEVRMVASLGSSSSTIVTWRNPLSTAQAVHVTLTDDPQELFNLLITAKKPGMGQVVGAHQPLQIPVSFAPRVLEESEAYIAIRMDVAGQPEPLVWRYRLRGFAEALTTSTPFAFTCRARETLEQPLEVLLAGLSRIAPEETFACEVRARNPEEAKLIAASFAVVPVDTDITDPAQPLRYKATFTPPRSFNTFADFIILKSGGGRWRFELALQALEPEVDGTLTIEAQVGQRASVRVPIRNDSTEPVPYKAHFSVDSSLDLEVRPKEGVLPADGAPGPLEVTFNNKSYGRTVTGTLIIFSPTDQWVFHVRGQQPSYKAPDKTKIQANFMSETAASSSASPSRRMLLKR